MKSKIRTNGGYLEKMKIESVQLDDSYDKVDNFLVLRNSFFGSFSAKVAMADNSDFTV
jgi:hypothetical protein